MSEIKLIRTGDDVKLDQRKTLVLNGNFQPMSYYPLSTWPWRQTMKLLAKGINTNKERFHTLCEYDDVEFETDEGTFKLPSVVALTRYIQPENPDSPAPFTKFNVMLRDEFTCQYTGKRYRADDLNFDHVIPASRGGGTNWENIVLAHRPINTMKSNRTPKEAGLELIREPYVPTIGELHNKGRKFPPNILHESWMDWLYWDTEIEVTN